MTEVSGVVKEIKALMYECDLLKIIKDLGGYLKTIMAKISVKRTVNENLNRAEDQTKMEGPKFKMIQIFVEYKFL